MDDWEIVEKGPASVFFTTVFIEQQTLGWPCSQNDTSVQGKRAFCFGGSGAEDHPDVLHRLSGQCSCTTHATYYPVGVEELMVWFEHAYDTTDKVEVTRDPSGAHRVLNEPLSRVCAPPTVAGRLAQRLIRAEDPAEGRAARHNLHIRGRDFADF